MDMDEITWHENTTVHISFFHIAIVYVLNIVLPAKEILLFNLQVSS